MYSNVSIIICGNDSATALDALPIDDLLESYKLMVDDGKSLSRDIRFVTIFPHDYCERTLIEYSLNASREEIFASTDLAPVNNN